MSLIPKENMLSDKTSFFVVSFVCCMQAFESLVLSFCKSTLGF